MTQMGLADYLRDTNLRLHRLVEGLKGSSALAAAPVASPQQIAALLSELRCTGEWLRTLRYNPEPELAVELGNYRQLVERLRDFLPAIHATLLRERARIECERSRVESVAQWARGSRETL